MKEEAALKAEIRFWEDMILKRKQTADPAMLERMDMARLLAEQKLALYLECCADVRH